MRIEDQLRTLRCPNEPLEKGGLLFADDKHEAFVRDFRITVQAKYLPNGRQWGLDRPEDTARDVSPITPLLCRSCGTEAIVEPYRYEPVETESKEYIGWKQLAIEGEDR
jgi:hypothetical protein